MSDTANNDLLEFTHDAQPGQGSEGRPWQLLVVDDEKEVHLITRMVLKDYTFDGHPLQILSAYSAAEAKPILQKHPDIAVILLDVVMETEEAGLELVKWIREDLGNTQVRIILRTGQPGAAPEKKVIIEYEINDYKAKTELTSIKLFTAVTSAIRAWRDLKTIQRSKVGLEKIISATATLYNQRAIASFIEGVLIQLTSLLNFEEDSAYVRAQGLALRRETDEFKIWAGTGKFSTLVGENLDHMENNQLKQVVEQALATKSTVFSGNYYAGYFKQTDGTENILLLTTNEALHSYDQGILQVFGTNVAMALENVTLNQKIETTQREIIFTLGEVVESRSQETGSHVKRVAQLTYMLGRECGLSEEDSQMLRLASPMHDVGKIGIPDSILLKPGLLTADEMIEMRKHTIIGYEILRAAGEKLLNLAAIVARSHHERWDGQGYPDGLAGEDIPLVARITCIVDVFDALCHKRVYKKAWSADDAFQYLSDNSGTLFDPKLVEIFMTKKAEILDILYGKEI